VRRLVQFLPDLESFTVAVGHPVKPLSDVGRADDRRAKIRRPAGVTRTFKVVEYSIEPSERSL